MKKNYGLPYQGSKNKLAEEIVNFLPQKKVLVDLFGGGGAISVCASQSGKYEKIIYNELNSLISETFRKAINGEYENERRWVSHEEFDQLKDKDGYVAICFSFSNNCNTYMYGPKIEPYKRAYHYAIVFNDFGPFNELFDDETTEKIKKSVEGITDLKERRIKFSHALGDYILSLERFEHLERKERLDILKHTMCLGGSPRHINENLECQERLDILKRTMSVKNENRGSSAAAQHIGCQEKFVNLKQTVQIFDTYIGNVLVNQQRSERLNTLKHTLNMIGSPRNATPHIECQEKIRITSEALEVFNKDYADVGLPSPDDCVIYCDIPYDKTYSYVTGGFDYERFYKWCQEKTSEGYQIYVSSYELPEDLFVSVWEKQRHCKATSGSGKHVVEKIFIPKCNK